MSHAEDGGIGLRLMDVPASELNDPRSRVYIVDQLRPGTDIHRNLEVSNTTNTAQHIDLYAAAATIANGAFLGAAGHTRNELSTWTSVRPHAVEVLPGRRVRAAVTVSIPNNASPGEQYGVVWAEVRSGPVGGPGITQVSRVGMRLYLWIGPGGAPAANFAIASMTAKRSPEGRPMVVANVRNTGGRALDMSGTLRLDRGPGRLSAGPFPAGLGVTLAVGDTEPVTIALSEQLPAGPWRARITLRSGLVRRTAEATLTFPRSGAARPVTPASRPRPSASLGAGAVVAVVVLLASVGAFVRWRRRKPRLIPT